MKEYRLPEDNTAKSLSILQAYVKTMPAKLMAIPPEDFAKKISPDKWSPKEVIGHLIDSATNNHHRFVRAQLENNPRIQYAQEQWNQANHYQELDHRHVIYFWALYNQHIIEVISRMPQELLQRTCQMGDRKLYTVEWLFDDYVRHLEHHLRQIPNLQLTESVIKPH